MSEVQPNDLHFLLVLLKKYWGAILWIGGTVFFFGRLTQRVKSIEDEQPVREQACKQHRISLKSFVEQELRHGSEEFALLREAIKESDQRNERREIRNEQRYENLLRHMINLSTNQINSKSIHSGVGEFNDEGVECLTPEYPEENG